MAAALEGLTVSATAITPSTVFSPQNSSGVFPSPASASSFCFTGAGSAIPRSAMHGFIPGEIKLLRIPPFDALAEHRLKIRHLIGLHAAPGGALQHGLCQRMLALPLQAGGQRKQFILRQRADGQNVRNGRLSFWLLYQFCQARWR